MGSATLLYSWNDIATLLNGGNVALATSVTAPTTVYPHAVVPIFAGIFEGLGHKITGLKINDTSGLGDDGLFATLVDGTVRDVGLIGVSVAGGSGQNVAGLVGVSSDLVLNTYISGAVSGGSNVGGLVGENVGFGNAVGVVENSYATAAVSGRSTSVA